MPEWLYLSRLIIPVGWLFCAALVHAVESDFEVLAGKLDSRYAPLVDWRESLRVDDLRYVERMDRYWRTADEIRSGRVRGGAPLAGVRLVLDPGHIGGRWASVEGRQFKVRAEDCPVREGELVLEVALRVRSGLEALGASVELTRTEAFPVNPRRPAQYLARAFNAAVLPGDSPPRPATERLSAIRSKAVYLSRVEGELVARARMINEAFKPDGVLSLHINAAPWPITEDGSLELVQSDHLHCLVFGCLTPAEFNLERHRRAMLGKLLSGSGTEEGALALALCGALADATDLPAARYDGRSAVAVDEEGYVWARNLLLLRAVDCPIVLLEPYVANSAGSYWRIQQALETRSAGKAPGHDDILIEYADAVIEGVLRHYGPQPERRDGESSDWTRRGADG